jgi:putative hydrolase of the HAD superfamily
LFDVVAFDADDTLWHNEILYANVQERFKRLLSPYSDAEAVEAQLYEIEMRNLASYGYGIKAFALSMIETAIELSCGRIAASQVSQIIGFAKEMLAAEVTLFEHAERTVIQLSKTYPLMLITKGDLLDQRRKLVRSGLEEYFFRVEVVADKTSDIYQALLKERGIAPQHFVMIGNSLRSDILPVVSIGATAIYVPQDLTWAHEAEVGQEPETGLYHQVEHLGQVPDLVARLNGDSPE